MNRNNQLIVSSTLQTTEDDTIFAIGDCATTFGGDTLKLPPRAQTAHQQAKHLACTLSAHIIKKQAFQPFCYKDYGSLISLSQRSAVGQLMANFSNNLFIEGILARLAYNALYRSHQMVIHGKWRTFMLILRDIVETGTQSKLKLH